MALIKCPECSREVSDKAQICVHCGFPLLDWKSCNVVVDSVGNVTDKSDKEIMSNFYALKGNLEKRVNQFIRENDRIFKKRSVGDMSEDFLEFTSEIFHDKNFISMDALLKEKHTQEIHSRVAYFFTIMATHCVSYMGWASVKPLFENVDFSIVSDRILHLISSCISSEINRAEPPRWPDEEPSVFNNYRHIVYGYLIYQVLLHGDKTINKDLLLGLKLKQSKWSKFLRIDNLLTLFPRMGIDSQEVDLLKKKYPILFDKTQKCSMPTRMKTGSVDNEWGDDVEADDEPCQDDLKTLYIYKGNIRCKKHNHNIISATATLHNISDKDVVINVEYCKDCHKYLLSYDLFLHYRAKYGVLIGDFKIVTNDFFDGETDLAEESPLHLSGYNVGQKDGYTSNQRHYILAKIIHDGIMTKQEVLNYLSYFVRMNGARDNMELAAAKWREDISFVQNYNISTQPSTIITKITRY